MIVGIEKDRKKITKTLFFLSQEKTKYSHNNNGDSTYSNDENICFGNSSGGGNICFYKTMNIGYNGNSSFQTNQDLSMKKGYFDAKEIEVYRAIY